MKVSVSYRKRGNRWHIRFRAKGRREIVKSFPETISEQTIEAKSLWFEEEIALGRVDPWTERSARRAQSGNIIPITSKKVRRRE